MNIPIKRYFDLLVAYLDGLRSRFLLLTVLLLTSIFMAVINPQISRGYIDTALEDGAVDTLTIAAVLFLVLAVLQQVFRLGAAYVGENLAWIATNNLRNDIARHCLNLDMRFHNDTTPGKLIERIDGDVSELAIFFSQVVVTLFGNLLLMICIVFAAALVDWRIGMVFALYTAFTVFGHHRIRSVAVPAQKNFREADADLFGFLEERLAGTEDLRSSGAVDYTLVGLYKRMVNVRWTWQKVGYLYVVIEGFSRFTIAIGVAVALFLANDLFTSGTITIGTAFMIVSYMMLLIEPMMQISSQVESLQNVGASIARVEELLAEQPTIVDGPGVSRQAGPASLAFENVTFGYDPAEPVLQDIDFALQPGEIMGLLGRTGSGKTTTTRLVFRLYDINTGAIHVDGHDIREFALPELRQRVAIVTQDVQLFQASVRDNITFFDRSIDDSRIMAVIDRLELREWFNNLPDGLDTRLETGGRSLSAGEAQLLAFTRVFLRDPGLVILDEASSRLDPATEQILSRAMAHLLEGRTGIIIAHRLSTIQRADSILILQDGNIIEHGDRTALAADPESRFADLLKTGLEEVLA